MLKKKSLFKNKNMWTDFSDLNRRVLLPPYPDNDYEDWDTTTDGRDYHQAVLEAKQIQAARNMRHGTTPVKPDWVDEYRGRVEYFPDIGEWVRGPPNDVAAQKTWRGSARERRWNEALEFVKQIPIKRAKLEEEERRRVARQEEVERQRVAEWRKREGWDDILANVRPGAKRSRDEVDEQPVKRLKTAASPAVGKQYITIKSADVPQFCEGILADEYDRILFYDGEMHDYTSKVELGKERPLYMFHENGQPFSVCANYLDFLFPDSVFVREFNKEGLDYIEHLYITIVKDVWNNELHFYYEPPSKRPPSKRLRSRVY
jgi:hypothetical protein